MNKASADILIVGGGAAGLSAAAAAADSRKAKVVLIDDNPHLGGQIWRAERGNVTTPTARALIEAIETGSAEIWNKAQVTGSVGDSRLAVEIQGERTEFEYKKLIIATGARERFLPFPGWTLPNVLGAGGLQALVKGGLKIADKRIVVAGTGPLLLAVAEYLKRKGSRVIAIVEQAPAAKINRFAFRLLRTPAKLVQGISTRAKLIGIPYWTDAWVTRAEGQDELGSILVVHKGKPVSIKCDYLACGFHLVPNLEIPRLLGCKIENGSVKVDEFQQTTLPNVYCAGESTGIAGVESALIEGRIAGSVAAGDLSSARRLGSRRNKATRFGQVLEQTFALRDELRSLADAKTVVCRCEDVKYGELTKFTDPREAKLQTRCGMGPCQGRICGAANEFLFAWRSGSVRAPAFPVKMENI